MNSSAVIEQSARGAGHGHGKAPGRARTPISGRKLVIVGGVTIALWVAGLVLTSALYPSERLPKAGEGVPVFQPAVVGASLNLAATDPALPLVALGVVNHPAGDCLVVGAVEPAILCLRAGAVTRHALPLPTSLEDAGDPPPPPGAHTHQANAMPAVGGWYTGEGRHQWVALRGNTLVVWTFSETATDFDGFKASVLWSAPREERPTALTWGDFDNDGAVDIALGCVSAGGSCPVRVLRGLGTGAQAPRFEPPREVFRTPGTLHLLALDADADGNLDLAVAAQASAPIVAYGDGHGFVPADIGDEQATFRGIAAADLDGSGRATLLFTNEGSTYPPVLRPRPQGETRAFYQGHALLRSTAPRAYASEAHAAGLFSLAAGWGPLLVDLNGDGKGDLVLGQNDPDFWVHRLKQVESKVLYGMRDGERVHFRPLKPTVALPSGFVHSVVAGDFNGDGLLDIAQVHLSGTANQGGTHRGASVKLLLAEGSAPHALLRLDAAPGNAGLSAAWMAPQEEAPGTLRPLHTPQSWHAQQGRGSQTGAAIALPPRPSSATHLRISQPHGDPRCFAVAESRASAGATLTLSAQAKAMALAGQPLKTTSCAQPASSAAKPPNSDAHHQG